MKLSLYYITWRWKTCSIYFSTLLNSWYFRDESDLAFILSPAAAWCPQRRHQRKSWCGSDSIYSLPPQWPGGPAARGDWAFKTETCLQYHDTSDVTWRKEKYQKIQIPDLKQLTKVLYNKNFLAEPKKICRLTQYKTRWLRAQTLTSRKNRENFKTESLDVLTPSLNPDFQIKQFRPNYTSTFACHASRPTP